VRITCGNAELLSSYWKTSFTIRHPWVVAFAFGLLYGFGFASALTGAGQSLHPSFD
jgi:hypothetical protein